MAAVAVEPAREMILPSLASDEIDALVGAATWYAKYHEPMIADLYDDASASAEASRERYQALHDALVKLGVRLSRPPGIRAA
jgi:hypothetical protein